MNRTMVDTIGQNSADIPVGAQIQMVGWYPDGFFAWKPGQIDRFRGRIPTVAIATVSEDWEQCSVVDCELGALTPAQSRQFIVSRQAFRPGTGTAYVNASRLASLLKACRGLAFDLWLASWLGRPPAQTEIDRVKSNLPAGVRLVAWQYEDLGSTDQSLVIADDWHPAP
jgi:hypothetical protein